MLLVIGIATVPSGQAGVGDSMALADRRRSPSRAAAVGCLTTNAANKRRRRIGVIQNGEKCSRLNGMASGATNGIECAARRPR